MYDATHSGATVRVSTRKQSKNVGAHDITLEPKKCQTETNAKVIKQTAHKGIRTKTCQTPKGRKTARLMPAPASPGKIKTAVAI